MDCTRPIARCGLISAELSLFRSAIFLLCCVACACERTDHFRNRHPSTSHELPKPPGTTYSYLNVITPFLVLAVVVAACAVKGRRANATARNNTGGDSSVPLTSIPVSENPMRIAALAAGRVEPRDLTSGAKAFAQQHAAPFGSSSASPGHGRASAAALRCSTVGMTTSASDQSLSALIQHDHLPKLSTGGGEDAAAAPSLPRSPALRAIPEASPMFEAMVDRVPEAPADSSSSIRGLVAELRAAQLAVPVSPSLGSASPPRAPPPLVDPATSSIPTLVADLRAAQLESQRRLVVAAAAAEAQVKSTSPAAGKAAPQSPRGNPK